MQKIIRDYARGLLFPGPRASLYWVAVKELKLSYHNGYIVNNRVSPK